MSFFLTKRSVCRAIAGVIGALLLISSDIGRAAQPSFDGGLVIKNGDAEYAEGGTWEAGQNKGDYYRYGMDHSEARKTTVPPYPAPDGSTPRVDRGNIVVCGQPRLILYGETLEEVMTDAADVPYYGDQFDKWKRQGLNTVGAIIQWNRFELRKDAYEYAMIDGLIEAARELNMNLIIVWFGTWRNLQSNYTGKYIEIVVRKAKEALNIPMYANAWCGESPCDAEYMDIFHSGCPSLDGMGPDNYGEVLHKYVRPWNVLVQPEFSPAEHYFRALSMGALLVGQYWQPEVELMRTKAIFDLVRTMEPLLVRKRNPGDLLGFTPVLDKKLHKAGSTWEQDYQNLKVTFTATVDHLPGETEWRDSRLHTASPLLNGNGLIIRMGPDDYIITATKIDVDLRRADGSDIGVAWAAQGHFEQGRWVKEKGAKIPGDGKSLKILFLTENGRYGQIRLKLAI